MSDPSTFRTWLKRRRTERGLTQEELGERVGYAGQTIRKIEGGQRRPSLQLALKLAQALQLSPEEQAAWMSAARAVAEPEEAATAPQPLRSPTPSPGLPAYLTPFVGRAQEQADLTALLGRPDCRLVSVLGPGGVGKTRLAIETARAVPGFTDGVAFVSLAPVATPDLVVPAIGDALGVAFSGAGDLLAQLIAYLRDQRVLLLLDNLEHLLDPSGLTLRLLEQLLAQAPNVSVLATSRERLRLAGEWVLELKGLPASLPHPHRQPDAAPALKLFVEHAERIDRAFRLTPDNRATITAICRLVGGLPLGIELAAAWLRLLTLDEIAQELTRDLDAVQLSPHALPARHHSLRAVVDHSWQLLSPNERTALRQLAVFQGGFTREAAAQVAEAHLPVLANLADKSLLRRGGGGRYDLHEVIRQYASGQLREQADEFGAASGRHMAFYLRLVAEREQRLKGADQVRAVAELSAEIDNIRAAWKWAAAHGPLDDLERAAEVLHWFYEFRGWFQEGAALFGQTVEQLRGRGALLDTAAGRRALGRMLGHYGYHAVRLGVFAPTQAALAESHALLTDVADSVGLGRTLYVQATGARWSGDYGEARRLLDLSLTLATTTGDRHVRVMCLTVASNVAQAVGEHQEAERLFREALLGWRELGNPRGAVWCLSSCSVTLLALGKHQEAQQLLRESLRLSYTTDDRYGTATTLYHLGLAAFQQEDVEAAIYFFREALPLLRSIGNWEYLQALNALAAALWQAGTKGEARRAYRDGLAAALEIEAIPEALQALSGLATLLGDSGDHAAALALAARVLADPASRDEARRSAAEQQRSARAHLSVDEAARIEEQVAALPLTAVLAKLVGPL
ncbi:MAG TPA: tetratricopeptide repeat protein [Roseiflexaceae bacterium]|nr:tetratricopeptide repeat protein [Roseiflexaceae bacterium]